MKKGVGMFTSTDTEVITQVWWLILMLSSLIKTQQTLAMPPEGEDEGLSPRSRG